MKYLVLFTTVITITAESQLPLSTILVREGNVMSSNEAEFIAERSKVTKPAIAKLLSLESIDTEKAPRIALCCSGGGIRALLCTLGWLSATQKTGLYDAITYCAVLSGSTWAYGSYLSRQLPLQKHTDDLIQAIAKGMPSLLDHEIMERLQQQKKLGRGVSLVDIWGVLIGNIVFPDHPESCRITMSGQRLVLAQGQHPFPLYTAISELHEKYRWFEFSPCQVWSNYLKAAITIEALGSAYAAGVPTKLIPEQSLEYYLGVCGSAFEAKFSSILQDYIKLVQLTKGTPDAFTLDDLQETRLSPARFKNYTFELASSPIREKRKMALVDAGLAFNLPFPPLLEPDRHVDIIIACDASQTITDGGALKGLQQYAQEHGIVLPPIDINVATSHLCTVWKNPQAKDGEVKAIIYIPRIANPAYDSSFDVDKESLNGFCATKHFKYKPEDARKLFGLAEFTMMQQFEMIKQVIAQVYQRK